MNKKLSKDKIEFEGTVVKTPYIVGFTGQRLYNSVEFREANVFTNRILVPKRKFKVGDRVKITITKVNKNE